MKKRGPAARLSGLDMLAEVDWFLEFGVHPWLIGQELGRSIESILASAKHYDRPDIRDAFAAAAQAERERIAFEEHPRYINQRNLRRAA